MQTRTVIKYLSAAALLAGAAQAHAIPTLRLTNGLGASVELADNAGTDLNPLAGAVVLSQSLDGWLVNVTTGLSKPLLGSALQPYLDLNSVNVSSTGPASGSLQIMLTDTDFTALLNGAHSLAEIGGTAGGSVSYRAFYDPSNTPFGQAFELPLLGAFGPGAFSGSIGGTVTSTTPYSLTLMVTINHTAAFQASSFDAALKVPEPGSLALLGVGLVALLAGTRRRVGLASAPLRG